MACGEDADATGPCAIAVAWSAEASGELRTCYASTYQNLSAQQCAKLKAQPTPTELAVYVSSCPSAAAVASCDATVGGIVATTYHYGKETSCADVKSVCDDIAGAFTCNE